MAKISPASDCKHHRLLGWVNLLANLLAFPYGFLFLQFT
jgi:hypothetical protein